MKKGRRSSGQRWGTSPREVSRRASISFRAIRVLYGLSAAACTLLAAQRALAEEAPDAGLRARLGLSANVGLLIIYVERTNPAALAVGINGRAGVQINNPLAIYYNNNLTFNYFGTDGDASILGVFDYNSVLLGWTPVDTFELGLGPSFDVIARLRCYSTGSCDSKTQVSPGFHLRLAGIIPFSSDVRAYVPASPDGHARVLSEQRSARRKGLSIGCDGHLTTIKANAREYEIESLPTFVGSLNLGFEWY